MPRYFESNRGQWPASQAFRAYGYGYGIVLGKDGVTLQIATPKAAKPVAKAGPKGMPNAAASATAPREVSLRFEGASSAAQFTGQDELSAKGAWFQGAEADWHSNIPLFGRVRESQVYSGVDATFYGREGQLEYDLDVAPGAKTGSLVFDLEGADKASIAKNGDLTIEVDGQQIVLHKPLAWQPDGQGRKSVEVEYALVPADEKHGQRVGLGLQGYDATKPLTIDPVLTFATYLSNASSALPDYFVNGIALDGSNNVYVLSTDSSFTSMTVQKLTSAGTLVYTATFSSANSTLEPTGLQVSKSGLAYISVDALSGYPTTSNAYLQTYPNHSYGGSYNGALAVLSANGSTLVYSTYFGGTANGSYGPDYATAVAVDGSGNAYLTGQAGGGNFPTTTGAYQTTYMPSSNASYVAKFNPNLSGTASLVYSTLIGGSSEYGSAIAVDGAGDAYLANNSYYCTGVTTPGAFSYSGLLMSTSCGYVTVVNPTGTGLIYSAYIGPGSPLSVAVDSSKDAYVTGDAIGADDFPTTPGAYQTSYPDGFAMELNPTGGLVYSTFLSGPSGASRSNLVNPASIALEPGCASACPAYIAAVTSAADFPVINGVGSAPPAISVYTLEPVFVVLNGTGSAATTSGYLSGLSSGVYYASSSPYPYVGVDTAGNAWLAGTLTPYNSNLDFPVTTTAAPGPTGAWLAEVSMSNAGNVIAVPSNLNFGISVPVNVSSTAYNGAPTTIALRNMGSAAVTLSSIVASPSYFAETDNCNGMIAAASYCTVTVVFTPPNDTPVTGTLTVTSNGINSPLVIPLSGQGSDANALVSSPSTLNFGNVTVNTTSAAQTATITNEGDVPAYNLNTVYFSTTSGFTGVTNCPYALPAGDSCQLSVTFAPGPTQVGPVSTTLYSPYYGYLLVNVNGTGVLPSSAGGTNAVALSATSLNFGTEAVGTVSGVQTVYLTNTGSLPLTFLAPTLTMTSAQGSSGDFQVGGYAYGVNTVTNPQTYDWFNVSFIPSVGATETATLTIPIAGSSTVYTISLVGQGSAATKVLEFQPGNAIFADQPVGTASTAQVFYVFNAGSTPFLVDRAIGSGDFTVTQTNCPGYSLLPGSAPGDVNTGSYCYVYVTFTPSQTGARTGTLTVIDGASATPQMIPLSGNGIAATGSILVTSPVLDFGTLVKGTSSAVQYVTIANPGDSSVTLTGEATSGDYAITYNSCGTSPTAIPPTTAWCNFGVTFTPTVTTSPDNGTLTITSSAGTQTVTLTGGGETGTLASGLSPTSVNFGQSQVGSNTSPVPIFVRNSGTEMLTFSTAATTTGDFTISNDYCGTGGNGTLAPGQDCQITVYFNPTASGTRTGLLTVLSNYGTLHASLSGTGDAVSTNPSYFTPAVGSFDQQAVNSISTPITLNFTYGGSISTFALTGASITAGSPYFQLATGANALNTCTAAQGSVTNCQVNVVFSPTTTGYHTGTLTVTSNQGSFTAQLAGYAPPVSDTGYLSPGALSFPSQVVSTTSTAQLIYLYNTGASAFTVGTVTGTNYGLTSEFSLYADNPGYDSCSGVTVQTPDSQTANGGSCYVYVQFTPSAAGTRTGTIVFPVTYSDGTTGTFTANLTGLGVAQKNEAILTPTISTYPDTAVGTANQTFTLIFTLSNPGNLPFLVGQLSGTNVTVGAGPVGDFTTYGDGCSGITITPASNCYIYAYFQPLTAGTRTGTITLPVTYANSTTPVNFTATLSGNAIAASPSIAISPAGIQFDSVTVNAGIPGDYQPVTVTNTGNLPITFTKYTLSTTFGMWSDGCTGQTLAPGTTCTDYVYFSPTAAGTISGSLNLTDNAPGSPQKVTLGGTALAATSELEFSQTTVSFGNVIVGNSSGQYTVNLINRGTDAVTINTIALAGADPGDYSENDSCAGGNLPANSICQIYLTFSPTATGSRTATLTETDTGSGGPRSVSISGSGINSTTAITFFPAALTFTSTEPVGEGAAQQFFSVNNLSPNPVTITAVASTNVGAFPVAQDGCTGSTLYTGGSCLIVVLYTPTASGSASAYIKVTDNATGSPQELPVSGAGITKLTSTVTLAANPTSAAFGSLFTLTATVIDQNSHAVTNGTVTFYDGTTVIGSAQVVSTTSGGGVIGTATLKTILIPLGANSITAKYVGADVTSTSAAVVATVTGTYPTTTTFASAGNPGDYTFTGTVQGFGPVVPTGSILFTDTTTGLEPGTATVVPGTLSTGFTTGPLDTAITVAPLVEAFADLNGDGIPDLVTGTTGGLFVQIGNGDGTFKGPIEASAAGVSTDDDFPTASNSDLLFGDFNGDGKTDIAFVACNNGQSECSVGVLMGNGDGTFQHERFYDGQGGSQIGGIAVADFNGDGILDIAVANFAVGSVDLLLGNGDGTFQEPIPTPMPGATSIAAGDLNGDGKTDLVISNWGYGTVSVLLGNGNGTFQTAASYSTPVSYYPTNVLLADLRHVGKLDILLQDYTYGVSALLGNGNGTFQAANPVFSPESPSYVPTFTVADMNGDGIPDLVVTDSGRIQVDVLSGTGTGTFGNPTPYPTGANPQVVAIADVNHDGRPDFAVANFGGPSVSILLNQVTQTATLSGTTVPGSGNHAVSGTYSGDTNFSPSTSNSLQLAASLVTSTITLQAEPSATVAWGQPLSIGVTLSRPLSWVPAQTGTMGYSIDGGAVTQVGQSGGSVVIPMSQLSVGTHTIAVSYVGDQYYKAIAAQSISVTIIKANQTISFTPPTSPVTYGVSPITLSATGGASGIAVTFSVVSGPGTVSGSTLTITGAGAVVVAANQAGNTDYNAATQVTQSVVVNKAAQTITFTPPTSPVTYGVAPITLSATGGASGNAVTFSIVSGPGTVSGSALTITGAGTVVVAANQAGSTNYNAATQVTQSVVVNQASQTITFTPPTSPVTYGVSPITLSATGGASGIAVTFSIVSGPGTISGSTLTITGAGTVVVAANQAGNTNYLAATQVTQSIVVNQAAQTITFTPPTTPVTYGVSPITLSATGGGSGNAVAFSIVSGPGTISGSTLTITGAGTVVVAANQAGNTNYLAAAQVTQSVVVNQAAQTITFTPPTTPVAYGVAPITLSATGGASGNAVTFSIVSGPGTVSGSTLTITGVGTVVVAANQAGNANYLAATQVTKSVVVNQAAQTITFTPPTSPVTYGVAAITLSATGGASGNAVTFSIVSGPGSISGNTLTITGAGTVVIAANQAGNTDYLAATQVTQSVVVNQATPIITWAAPAAIYNPAPLTATQLDATASVGGNFVYNPAVGAVLSGGSQTLSATFTPTSTNYKTVTATTTLVVYQTAAISSPTPGSTLTGSSATFTWSAGYGVTQYDLHVGTTAAGSTNIFSGSVTGTSQAVTGIPTTGGTLYVRLYSYIAGAWQYTDYSYTELNPVPAAMTSPAPGSTLTGSSATFTWTTGTDVTQYNLHVGTTGAGSSNIFAGTVTGQTKTVTGIPLTGATLNVRLSSYIAGAWQYIDYTYTEANAVPAAITSPTPSSTLTGSSATFSWTVGSDVTQYDLKVGTTGVGSSNIFGGIVSGTSQSVTGIPVTGGTLNVRLLSLIAGAWQSIDYTYTEANAVPAALTSPTPSSTLTGSSATFSWTTGSDVTQYDLKVGTTGVGSYNLFGGVVSGTSQSVTGIPITGGTLNVRLESLISGTWQSIDYTYTEADAVAASLTAPTPSSTLTGSSATFTWTAGSLVTEYDLKVGTTGVGSYNLFSGTETGQSQNVTGIPTTGGTLYVRLESLIAGTWQSTDYTFTEISPAQATMLTPMPGSTLTGSGATFTWTTGSLVTEYDLKVGTTGVGSYNLFSGIVAGQTQTVTGIPTTGGTLYVRLESLIAGTWQYTDYTYTEQ
jgi:hypothetical protein